MKRKIGFFALLALEIAFCVVYFIRPAYNGMVTALPFVGIIVDTVKSWFYSLEELIAWDFFQSFPSIVQHVVLLILFNIAFFALYFLVFGIIAKVQENKIKEKLKENNSDVSELSEEEKAKFEWRLFERKFPWRRIISLIIPLALITLFIFVRFDKTMCAAKDSYRTGYFTWYSDNSSYFGFLSVPLEFIVNKYIGFNNHVAALFGGLWIEYVILSVVFIAFLLLWWGFFSLFAKPFRESRAKAKANRAKVNYILKMENIEYNAIRKAEKENKVSKKNKDLYGESEYALNPSTDVDNISESTASVVDERFNELREASSKQQQNYIDDISTGVTDLGVVQEDDSEIQEPITSRETHFVGDEEIDIVLEKEPVIETIEEEESFYDDVETIEEETFERYQPENASSIDIEDKIKKYNIDIIEENQDEVERYAEEQNPVIENYEDVEDVIIASQETTEAVVPSEPAEEKPSEPEEIIPESEESTQEETIEDIPEAPVQEVMESPEESALAETEQMTVESYEETYTEEEPVINDEPSEEVLPEETKPEEKIPVPEIKEEPSEEVSKPEADTFVKYSEEPEETATEADTAITEENPPLIKQDENTPRKKPSKPLVLKKKTDGKISDYIIQNNQFKGDDTLVHSETPAPQGETPAPKNKPLTKIRQKKNVKPVKPMKVGKK